MFGVPSTATARMGSALGLIDAAAMGTAPTSTTAMAAMAASDPGQVAREPPGPTTVARLGTDARSGSAGGALGAAASTATRAPRDRHPDDGQVARDEHERHRHHAVGIGPDPSEEPEVLDEDPVRRAQRRPPRTTPAARPDGRPVQNAIPIAASRITTTRLTPHPCDASKRPKPRTDGRQGSGLSGLGHLADHGGERARASSLAPSPARSPARARPAGPPCRAGTRPSPAGSAGPASGSTTPDRAAPPGLPPRNRRGRHPVSRRARRRPSRRSRRTPRRTPRRRGPTPIAASPANRDHRPRGARRSRAPIPSWSHTADAAAWTGWSVQIMTPKMHHVLDPSRRRARRGLEHAGRQAERHGRLELEQPVEDPQQPEPDAQDATGDGLGAGSSRTVLGRGSNRRPTERRYWVVRRMFHTNDRSTRTRPMRSIWWRRAVWNDDTTTGFLV